MNESIKEDLQIIEKAVSGNSGVSVNIVDVSGNGNASVSAGSSGETYAVDVSGNGSTGVSSGNSYTVIGSSSDIGAAGTVADIQTSVEILEEIRTLNVTLLLLFFFLLMAWAEKKITVVVRRFSRER